MLYYFLGNESFYLLPWSFPLSLSLVYLSLFLPLIQYFSLSQSRSATKLSVRMSERDRELVRIDTFPQMCVSEAWRLQSLDERLQPRGSRGQCWWREAGDDGVEIETCVLLMCFCSRPQHLHSASLLTLPYQQQAPALFRLARYLSLFPSLLL